MGGFNFGNGRRSNLGDPKYDKDAVNLRTLNRASFEAVSGVSETVSGITETRVQPGANINTGGTKNSPIISLKDAIELSSVDTTTLEANAITSGGTNVDLLFVHDVTGGANITATGGANVTVNLDDSINLVSVSANTISGGTLFSGATDLSNIFAKGDFIGPDSSSEYAIVKFADTTGKKKSERSYVGGGTFSANPASMVSGYATLNHLKSKKSVYSKINSLGEFARKGIGKTFDGKVTVTGKGSLFMTHFLKNGITEVTNSGQAAKCDSAMLAKYHFKMIAHDGIFFLPGKLGAISDAHSKEDIKKMIRASENF